MKLALTLACTAAVASAFAPMPTLSSQRQATRLAAGLWDEEGKSPKKEMSKALPFSPRPKLLDGTLPGDVGFEYVESVGPSYPDRSQQEFLITHSHEFPLPPSSAVPLDSPARTRPA
jgi:hypothetical protein